MARSQELVERLAGRPPPATGRRRATHRARRSGSCRARRHLRLVADGPRLPARTGCGSATSSRRTARPAGVRRPTSIELPFSWTLDDYVYLEFVTFRRMLMPGLRRPEDMFANFTGDVAWMVREVRHGVCTVVFHPQVIGRGHRLLALEHWLDEISRAGRELRPHGPRRPGLRRRPLLRAGAGLGRTLTDQPPDARIDDREINRG